MATSQRARHQEPETDTPKWNAARFNVMNHTTCYDTAKCSPRGGALVTVFTVHVAGMMHLGGDLKQ